MNVQKRRRIFARLGVLMLVMTCCFETALAKDKEKTMSFDFNQEDLSAVLKKYAKKRGLNLMLPQGTVSISQKITFKQPEKVSINRAEQYIKLFLELAGYSMYPKGDLLMVSKLDANNTHNAYPIYINTSPSQLPHSPEHIHAIYYLANLKVPQNMVGGDSISAILTSMLSPKNQAADWFFDQRLNAVIITDRADSIAAAMNVILALDASGSKEMIGVIPLYHTSADTIAKLFQDQIFAQQGKGAQFKATTQTESSFYFEANTVVIASSRNNSLIIIGRENAIERIRKFIADYIDVPLESGKSLIHVYDLQYLNSEEFAPILINIVEGKRAGAQSIEKSDAQTFFDGVKIVADTIKPIKPPEGQLVTTAPVEGSKEAPITIGGNRLVVAAKQEDWLRIKKLIQELDQPERYVLFEILVIDFSAASTKDLDVQLHTPEFLNLTKGMQFQSAQMVAPFSDAGTDGFTMPEAGLNEDFLRLLYPGRTYSTAYDQTKPNANLNGSMIVSFKEGCSGGIWSLFAIMQQLGQTRILEHPYIVTLNNRQGSEQIITRRYATGSASMTSTGYEIKVQPFDAVFYVACQPRIASSDTLGFKFDLVLTEFLNPQSTLKDPAPSSFDRFTRQVSTFVNMRSGDLLAVGGLARTTTDNAIRETPLLSKIPIIGNLFRGREKGNSKNNLVVLIVPTIVEPKYSEKANAFSAQKVREGFVSIEETDNYPEVIRDPIQRFFFGKSSQDSDSELLRAFISDGIPSKEMHEAAFGAVKDDKLKSLYKDMKNPIKKQGVDSVACH